MHQARIAPGFSKNPKFSNEFQLIGDDEVEKPLKEGWKNSTWLSRFNIHLVYFALLHDVDSGIHVFILDSMDSWKTWS